jgi:flagellar hook-length control protein FliK
MNFSLTKLMTFLDQANLETVSDQKVLSLDSEELISKFEAMLQNVDLNSAENFKELARSLPKEELKTLLLNAKDISPDGLEFLDQLITEQWSKQAIGNQTKSEVMQEPSLELDKPSERPNTKSKKLIEETNKGIIKTELNPDVQKPKHDKTEQTEIAAILNQSTEKEETSTLSKEAKNDSRQESLTDKEVNELIVKTNSSKSISNEELAERRTEKLVKPLPNNKIEKNDPIIIDEVKDKINISNSEKVKNTKIKNELNNSETGKFNSNTDLIEIKKQSSNVSEDLKPHNTSKMDPSEVIEKHPKTEVKQDLVKDIEKPKENSGLTETKKQISSISENLKSHSPNKKNTSEIVETQMKQDLAKEMATVLNHSEKKATLENNEGVTTEKILHDSVKLDSEKTNQNTKDQSLMVNSELKKEAQQDHKKEQQNEQASQKHLFLKETPEKVSTDFKTQITEQQVDVHKKNFIENSFKIEEKLSYKTSSELLEKLSALIKKHEVLPTGEQKMLINIFPEELGKIEIQVKYHQHRIETDLIVTTDKVRELIENNISQLKDSLESKGIQLERFDVKRETQSEANHEKQKQGQSEQNSKENHQKNHEQSKQQRQRYRQFYNNTFEYLA